MQHLICRVQFTPEDTNVTLILADNINVIDPRLREVTLFFADIKKYSVIIGRNETKAKRN